MDTVIETLKCKLIETRSVEDSIYCTIEELSEITKVLCKFLRKSDKFNIDDLIEELSHSLLMLDVIRKRFNISNYVVSKEQLRALEKCQVRRVK